MKRKEKENAEIAAVLRAAAKEIEDIEDNAAGYLQFAISRVRHPLSGVARARYVRLYGPGSRGIGEFPVSGGEDYLPATAFRRPVDGSGELSNAEANAARVIALCFAAAMAETGDLPE